MRSPQALGSRPCPLGRRPRERTATHEAPFHHAFPSGLKCGAGTHPWPFQSMGTPSLVTRGGSRDSSPAGAASSGESLGWCSPSGTGGGFCFPASGSSSQPSCPFGQGITSCDPRPASALTRDRQRVPDHQERQEDDDQYDRTHQRCSGMRLCRPTHPHRLNERRAVVRSRIGSAATG